MEIKKSILVCGGAGCLSSKSNEIIKEIEKTLEINKLKEEVEVKKTGCFGFCKKGPIVKVIPSENFYIEVKPEDGKRIVEEDIIGNGVVEELLYIDPKTNEKIKNSQEIDFYKKQKKVALKNCGIIDPLKIEDYIKKDGYKGLEKVLKEMTPEEVVEVVKDSGLRGRGGGGYSTGKKWEAGLNNKQPIKYIVCNADEGDPGAFMDRSILEGDPHSIIEAMIICGYAIGASKGLIYIRAEYPLAISILKVAIDESRRMGFLGEDIMGSGFSFNIEIKYGAGAFVCGEATALVHSMEGKRGEPTTKPPHLVESGYWGKPTNVNNVETFANIPIIILKGSKWFKDMGTERSSGTKVFALAGKVNNVGLVEVPMGITLREVVYEIGGGIPNGKKLKAIQTGGPSGGCLIPEDLDTPIDFDNLVAKGSMMGSGGMIIMDEDDCMVDIAKFYLEFTVEESCGKCTPCRIGNKRMLEILEKITKGNGTLEDLDLLEELSTTIKETSLCGLGQSAPNPVLMTLKNFRDEYEAHVVEKRCPAKKCKDLVKYSINDNCVGCTACARNCPQNCITGEVRSKHVIDSDRCIKCGICFEKCNFKAIDRV